MLVGIAIVCSIIGMFLGFGFSALLSEGNQHVEISDAYNEGFKDGVKFANDRNTELKQTLKWRTKYESSTEH